jgi:hypothetical protein
MACGQQNVLFISLNLMHSAPWSQCKRASDVLLFAKCERLVIDLAGLCIRYRLQVVQHVHRDAPKCANSVKFVKHWQWKIKTTIENKLKILGVTVKIACQP